MPEYFCLTKLEVFKINKIRQQRIVRLAGMFQKYDLKLST